MLPDAGREAESGAGSPHRCRVAVKVLGVTAMTSSTSLGGVSTSGFITTSRHPVLSTIRVCTLTVSSEKEVRATLDTVLTEVDLSGLGRAQKVLSLFGETPNWRMAEIVRATGFAKTTVHRLVTTLADLGFLRRTAQGGFVLGSLLFQITEAGALESEIRRIARLHLARLHQLTQLQVILASKAGPHVIVLDVWGHYCQISPGACLPSHSGIGQALIGGQGGPGRPGDSRPPTNISLNVLEISADAASISVRVDAQPGLPDVPHLSLCVVGTRESLNIERTERIARETSLALSKAIARRIAVRKITG